MRAFAEYVCIDWSGADSRWQPGISVASCAAGDDGPRLVPSPGLHWTRRDVLDWLTQKAASSRAILVGLDLSFALPFIDAGAYFPGWRYSPSSARQLWAQVDALSQDQERLSASRFLAHPEIARHFRQAGYCGDKFGSGRGRLRQCEANGQALIDGITPYSCFNLIGAAQVGKSSLTGMRLLHRLASKAAIWPFDPPDQTSMVIVEIYTSIAASAARVLPPGRSKIRQAAMLDAALARFGSAPHCRDIACTSEHAIDALLTAAWLRHVADQRSYWHPARLDGAVRTTEGWTFGVL